MHRPNVEIFQLESGSRKWFVTGCYIAPNNDAMVEGFISAIVKLPRRTTLLVAGDFNADLYVPEGGLRGGYIAASMATPGLYYIATHLLLRRKAWVRYGRT